MCRMCLLRHWIQSSMHTRDAIIKGLTLKRKTWQFENRFKHHLDDYDLLQQAQHSILAYPSHIPFYGWIEKEWQTDSQIQCPTLTSPISVPDFLDAVKSLDAVNSFSGTDSAPTLQVGVPGGGHPVFTIFQYQWTKQGEYLHIIMDLTHFFSRFLHSFLLVWYHPWLFQAWTKRRKWYRHWQRYWDILSHNKWWILL